MATTRLPPSPAWWRFEDPPAVWQAYLDRGVLIRDPGIPGFLRATVGTENDNEAFLSVSAGIKERA